MNGGVAHLLNLRTSHPLDPFNTLRDTNVPPCTGLISNIILYSLLLEYRCVPVAPVSILLVVELMPRNPTNTNAPSRDQTETCRAELLPGKGHSRHVREIESGIKTRTHNRRAEVPPRRASASVAHGHRDAEKHHCGRVRGLSSSVPSALPDQL